MNLLTAASAVDGQVVGGDAVFEHVVTDTRELHGGELFIALQGEHFDGQDFVQDAIRSGAAAVMANRQLEVDLPTLVVTDTIRSLGQLAAYWREQFAIPLIAVTGSNGKTTVREMITRILEYDGPTLASTGNFNNQIGLPLTLLKLRDFHRYSVLEMGMNHPGEIGCLTRIAKPTIAVITNAASAHLEGLGDVTGVARAKAEMFLGMRSGSVAVINGDDRFATYWLARGRRYRTLTFGLESQADVRGEVEWRDGDMDLEIRLPEESFEVKLNLLGRHNARNALAAAAVGWTAGVSAQHIREGLEQVLPIAGRLQPRKGRNKAVVIDDSYNANPASLRCAVRVLARKDGYRVLALGDMAELGRESEAFHRAAGRYAREKGIQRLLTTGTFSHLSAEEFGSGATHYDNPDELADELLGLLSPQVYVLVKGSRSARMERVVEVLLE